MKCLKRSAGALTLCAILSLTGCALYKTMTGEQPTATDVEQDQAAIQAAGDSFGPVGSLIAGSVAALYGGVMHKKRKSEASQAAKDICDLVDVAQGKKKLTLDDVQKVVQSGNIAVQFAKEVQKEYNTRQA